MIVLFLKKSHYLSYLKVAEDIRHTKQSQRLEPLCRQDLIITKLSTPCLALCVCVCVLVTQSLNPKRDFACFLHS